MALNSRILALMVAVTVAVITVAFLSLIQLQAQALIIAFLLAFSSTYILVNVVLEFIFFREIATLREALSQKNETTIIESEQKYSFNPLKQLNREVHQFAENKAIEIAELKRMEIFRREFLADVSHELKTPIFSAQGYVHTLLDGAVEDKRVRRKFLKKAAKSLDALQLLVQDLLILSQLESGDIKMRIQKFDIVKLAESVMEQFEAKAIKKQQILSLSQPVQPVIYVAADIHRINQVLTNLISNAVKYTDINGEITLFFEIHDQTVHVHVKDTGKGISPDDIQRIFERFYRVEKSRSKEKGGTGLGLAIVKHIINAHQSEIIVTSVLGQGSDFCFYLPIAQNQQIQEISYDDEEE